jgi:hypothetical protein
VAILDEAVRESDTAGVFDTFTVWLSLEKIESMFGGIIPTDIQGTYRSGIPTVSTASESPWYHTKLDTPDKVDTKFLAKGVRSFDRAVQLFLTSPVERFEGRDKSLWGADVTVIASGTGQDQALVEVRLTDASGDVLPDTDVTTTLFCDDFFAAPDVVAKTDAHGVATFGFVRQLVDCPGKRYVHVSAGPDHPRVEKVASLPSAR